MSKKTPVDTKSPDAFQVTMYKVLDWALKNKKALIGVILPIILIAVGLIGWKQIAQSSAESRRLDLAVIDDSYSDEMKKFDDRRKSLQDEIDTLNKDKKNKTKNKAKVEKLEKEIESLKADHSGSLALYSKFMNENQGSVEGMRAGVSAANIQIENEKLKEAKAILDKILKASPRGQFFNVQVRLVYANLMEELGDKEGAVKELDKVLVNAMDSIKPQILFNKGRILLQMGKKKDADSTFLELTQKFATSQEARKVAALKIVE